MQHLIFNRWLPRLVRLWIRWRCYPENPGLSLGLDPRLPTLYVIKHRSALDYAVLQNLCRHYRLPLSLARVEEIATRRDGEAACLPLLYAGLWGEKQRPRTRQKIVAMLEQGRACGQQVQIVPVSIFWGRNPGTGKSAPIRSYILYGPDAGGMIKKIIQFFLHGRRIFCHFGQITRTDDPALRRRDSVAAARLLDRLLRVHFRRQHDTVVGSAMYWRGEVIRDLVAAPPVQRAAFEEAAQTGQPLAEVKRLAATYGEEVVANLSPNAAELMTRIMRWMVRRTHDGFTIRGTETLKEVAEHATLVLVPSHRSHADYLLLNYIFYQAGFVPLHTVAGDNLNFWPIGAVLRRGGAIFIRRRFQGNRLYARVLSQFIRFLLRRSFPICVYTEGGRSRTGRLLEPKVGILKMIVGHSAVAQPPLAFVPVFIGYDRVPEIQSYVGELSGRSKTQESLHQMLQARKVLKRRFGRAYFCFGQALTLEQLGPDAQRLTAYCANAEGESEGESKDDAAQLLEQFGRRLHVGINAAAMLTPVTLVATLLLAGRRNAMVEGEVVRIGQVFTEVLRHFHPTNQGMWHECTQLGGDIARLTRFTAVECTEHPGGRVLHFHEESRGELHYLAGTVQHLFVPHGLLLGMLTRDHFMTLSELVAQGTPLYHFAQEEYFLQLSTEAWASAAEKALAHFTALGWVEADGQAFRLAPRSQPRGKQVRLFVETAGSLLDRLALLLYSEQHGALDRERLLGAIEQCCVSGAWRPDLFSEASCQLWEAQRGLRQQLGLGRAGHPSLEWAHSWLLDRYNLA